MTFLAFLKLRKQDFEGKKMVILHQNQKLRLFKSNKDTNYLHGIMVSQTNINQAEKYFKKAIELGIIYGYGLSSS
jgi:hypothetical protein